MTFRQILAALWQRKWIIITTIAIAMVAAGAYLQVRPETYESTAVARPSDPVAQGIVSGRIGEQSVRFDPTITKDATILEPAAAAAGDSLDTLRSNIDVSYIAGEPVGRVYIVGTGDTPQQARIRAQSVLDAYTAYLEQALADTTAAIQERLVAVTKQAEDLQRKVANDPTNQILAADLGRSISQIGSLRGLLDSIATSGTALTVTLAPDLGKPTFPSTAVVLLTALLAALVAGIGIALIYDQFDDKLRSEDDVEILTGSQPLGSLPFDRTLSSKGTPLPIEGRSRSPVTEGIRALRASLQVMLPAKESLLVVTSVEPSDGKTFISSNLALAWAFAGKQVILVGGDLRKPDLGMYFGDSADGPGLAELLEESDYPIDINTNNVSEALRPTPHRRLRILPSGDEPHDPADLLASPRLGNVLHVLTGLADIVIIDSPPAMRLVDASLLAGYADGILVIGSIRRTSRARLTETLDKLRQNGVKILGVAVNRSRRRLPKSYSAYYMKRGSQSERSSSAVSG